MKESQLYRNNLSEKFYNIENENILKEIVPTYLH